MKKLLQYIFTICIASLTLLSCTEELYVYSMQENRLGFYINPGQDTVQRFSFVYLNSSITTDTVWVQLNTSGHVTDYDRPFELEQVPATANDTDNEDITNNADVINAVAGQHYISFDDSSIKQHLVIKAGENSVKVPLVLKRDESLQTSKVYLKLKLKENEHFKESFIEDRSFVIESSDMLVKPVEWGGAIEYYFSGTYGPVKLRFMIDCATWTLDDKWFAKHFSGWNIDMGYTGYLSSFFTDELIKLNKERVAQGLDVLKEEDGTIVQFTLYAAPQPYI